MIPRLYCGTFEPETFWRDAGLARLPFINDRGTSRIVQAMDEMLFALCVSGDGVLTVRHMNEAHVEYLHSIGFSFFCNRFDLTGAEGPDAGACTVFDRMLEPEVASLLDEFLPSGMEMAPFAVLPGAAEASKRFGLCAALPPQDVLREVNTKSYSVAMRDRLDIPNVGTIVNDAPSLMAAGRNLLSSGPFLIKDDFGVSGKGNQIVQSERVLDRIAGYLSRQTAAGKQIRFVIEPYLPKKLDFSCQIKVGLDGDVQIVSVHQLENDELAFGASRAPDSELIAALEKSAYFQLMEAIGVHLSADGYFGEAGIDSMVLSDGQMAPLIEINARRTMSSIRHAIDMFIGRPDIHCRVASLNVAGRGTAGFSGLLARLSSDRLLFEAGRERGILPLTAGTMPDQDESDDTSDRGRIYFASVYRDPSEVTPLRDGLRDILKGIGLQVMQ
jgi:hypothetical protein